MLDGHIFQYLNAEAGFKQKKEKRLNILLKPYNNVANHVVFFRKELSEINTFRFQTGEGILYLPSSFW